MDVRIERVNGTLCFLINKKVYPPMAFKSFRPNPVNISEFYKAGVRLYNVLSSGVICALGVPYSLFGESWIGENKYDFSPLDRQMDMFIKYAPDAYYAPMFQIDTRPWYLAQHPDSPNSFTNLSQIAGDYNFRQKASHYLKAMITHCEEKYNDRIYGYFLLGGTTTEWFSDFDYEATHPFKEAAFKRWKNDQNAVLPSIEKFDLKGTTFLSKDEDDVREARKFHAELISDLILHFASEAQSIIRHRKLLGIYYGYLFEFGAPRLFNAGHLDYEKIFFSDDIDMFSSPSSYGYRGQLDPSAFMVTQKTLYAHNKLYFNEFDHRTHTMPTMLNEPVEDPSGNMKYRILPGTESRCKNEEESLNLMYRDFLLCQQTGAAIWWFDMFDGWFRSEGMMKAISDMRKISAVMLEKDMSSSSEIAVFAGGEALYGVRKTSKVVNCSLNNFRRNLAQIGAPYDVYSFSDCMLNEVRKYKLYIFLNAYDIPEKTAEYIHKELAKEGKTVLWLYAPDYAHNSEYSVDRIKTITGMNIKQQEESHGDFIYKDTVVTNTISAPYFCIDDPAAVPYAYYSDGTVACAEKESNNGRTIYCTSCNPPSLLLRDLAKSSGCFIYSYDNRVYTYVNKAIVGVYNASDTDAVISVPNDGRYLDIFKNEYYIAKNGIIRLPKRALCAYMLLLSDDI